MGAPSKPASMGRGGRRLPKRKGSAFLRYLAGAGRCLLPSWGPYFCSGQNLSAFCSTATKQERARLQTEGQERNLCYRPEPDLRFLIRLDSSDGLHRKNLWRLDNGAVNRRRTLPQYGFPRLPLDTCSETNCHDNCNISFLESLHKK